jgi:hypothetical protein
MTTSVESLRFVPKRVEGLPDVGEVVVFADRLELLSAGKWVVVRFAAIADHGQWLHRLLSRLVFSPEPPCVGKRDWFNAPEDRFVSFCTTPRFVVYFPDEPGAEYDPTCFRRLQKIITQGGFALSMNEPRGARGSNRVPW